MNLRNNYYLSSFFWSTFQKILSAVVGFISVPLLLGYYGKLEYGILGIATACNGYMHLLDLGMDTGAVRFYSQWKSEGNMYMINRVARTNITFYFIIAFVNSLGLLALALWGKSLFAVNEDQFQLLRTCLIIIALFSFLSWGATTFNQLLVADMQMAFTMKVQSVIAILKAMLIGMVFLLKLTLIQYFFLLTCVLSILFLPYSIKCHHLGLIDSFRPAFYWKDYKVVILFSLSVFSLSLFQITASQSRPIILSIFAKNGAEAVADFRIIEVIPQLIIMIGGVFTSIFLPKVSSMVSMRSQKQIASFAYTWTTYTTIIINVLTIPFILCSKEVLFAYVGKGYEDLAVWLIIWCVTVLIQMHTTPSYSLVLAYGKTRLLVITTAIACVITIVLNIILASKLGVGASVLSYFVYVTIIIGLYYVKFYKKVLGLKRTKIFVSFLKPTVVSAVVFLLVYNFPITIDISNSSNGRVNFLFVCLVKSFQWFVLYILLLLALGVISFKKIKNQKKDGSMFS